MPKKKQMEIGAYVEIVVHGHGCHEVVAAYDFNPETAEEVQKLFDTNKLFSPRKN